MSRLMKFEAKKHRFKCVNGSKTYCLSASNNFMNENINEWNNITIKTDGVGIFYLGIYHEFS